MVSPLIQAVRRRATGCADAAASLLFPPSCAFCAVDLPELQQVFRLCEDCQKQLGPVSATMCRRCGAEVSQQEDTHAGCHVCRKSPVRFDAAVALGLHHDELRSAVLRIKRPHDEPLARALAELLYLRRREELIQWAADVIVPVPMHWARRAVRGTNSAETVAVRLARRLGVPAAVGALRRRRNTKPQGGLPRRQRFQNVRDAFCLSAGYYFNGARVVLVDDIMTTGATLGEASKVLSAAGADSVFAAVLARAHGPD